MTTGFRAAAVMLASALVALSPAVAPGLIPAFNKGPFDIDPRTEEPDTDFTLSFSGTGCGQLIPPTASLGEAPDIVLLTAGTNVHVQVVGPRPSDTVVMQTTVVPDQVSGDWMGTFPPMSLTEGDYLVTASCDHSGIASDPQADSASSRSETAFILLGEEQARCHEGATVDPPFDTTGPGCYEPQELVIEVQEAGPAEAEEEEPDFTG